MLVAERLATKSSVVLLCVFGLLSGTWGVRSDARPFTASDTINRERIGAVVASPNGDFLVFERESAYGSGSDFTFAMAGEPWGRSDLYIVSTLGGEPTPMRLLPVSDGRRLTLGGLLTSGSFSPDGRKITVYWPDGPSIHLGYYDFELNRLVEISNSPVVEPSRVQPVWLSATRLMYMAAASRTEHWAADRYRVAVSMASQWANARAGRSTALIFASGVAAEQFENHYGGNLFVYDTVEQQQRLLSPGRYSTISISPDGSSIAALHLIGRAALPPGGESDLEFDRGEIVLFGLDGRQHGIASCASCDVLHDSIAWSADSGRLAYFARPLGGTTSQGNYWLFDVKLKMQLSVDARAVKLERANFFSPAGPTFSGARGKVFVGGGAFLAHS